MLFPSLTGYIDKAADDKLVSKARSLYNASQATVSSHYAINPSFEKTTSYFEDSGMNDEIISLSEVKGEFECFIALDSVYRVTELFILKITSLYIFKMDLSRFQKTSQDLQIQTLPLKEVAFMCRVENFQKQSEREELTTRNL